MVAQGTYKMKMVTQYMQTAKVYSTMVNKGTALVSKKIKI